MKSVVVCLDLNHDAKHILDYAINLSNIYNTDLILFHAYQVPIAYSEIPVVSLSLDEIKNKSEEKLNHIKTSIQESIKNKVRIELVLGEPANEIQNFCKTNIPEMLIIGTGHSKALERSFTGSTTLHAVNHLNNPIIIIPENAEYTDIKKMGFACDYLQIKNKESLLNLLEISKKLDSSLDIIHVEETNRNKSPENQIQKDILIEIFKTKEPVFHEIKNDDIETVLHHFIQKNNINIITIIPRTHKKLKDIFKKKHRKDIIFHSEVPVLCIHE